MALAVVGDELWAGTMIGGLNVIKDGRVDRVYRFDREAPRSLSSSAVSRIYLDSKGRQWIATYGGGINLFEPGRGFKRFPSLSNPKGQFSDLRTLDIIETRAGLLWVATDGGGITVLDSVTGDTSTLLYDPNDSASLSSNNIVALLETDQGIWVGTRDRGINFTIRFPQPSRGIRRPMAWRVAQCLGCWKMRLGEFGSAAVKDSP